MEKLELKAMAKVNLGLDVLGRRENGYHDVRMVMQTVWLYDRVTLIRTKEAGIQVKTNLKFLPVDENNIAYKAAALLMEEFHPEGGIEIRLEKYIPVAAGLAGGSSNAAAVLFGMNRMYGWNLTMEELMKRGVKLGADVPYCLMRGTVLAEGIGEKLTRLPAAPRCYVLLAKPPISVSTKTVYEKLDSREITNHPDIDGILNGLKENDLDKVAGCMGNVLECVTEEAYPVIGTIKKIMKEAGALNAIMSGSGPTVFGLFSRRGDAIRAKQNILSENLSKQVYLTNIHRMKEEEVHGE
ncbi:MAG TPA: 4-(cytidine 5'-diphospho)-2-C-methyl-D-erythritol kinase [Lachnospiraceae bacterium]|nr:4-(cytidine 5'-diphospho)-2-C-methyl-D-erythritol kinase [Lachnospiraceae bacterium]